MKLPPPLLQPRPMMKMMQKTEEGFHVAWLPVSLLQKERERLEKTQIQRPFGSRKLNALSISNLEFMLLKPKLGQGLIFKRRKRQHFHIKM